MSRFLSVHGLCLAVVLPGCGVEQLYASVPRPLRSTPPASMSAGAPAEPAQDTEESDCDWRAVTRMPERTRGQAVVELAGTFYSFGGLSQSEATALGPNRREHPQAESLARFYTSVRAYDAERDQWTTKARMPIGLYVLTANHLGDQIFVFGGYNGDGFQPVVHAYDPTSDSWTQHENMPTRRYIFTSDAVADKAYVIGGHGPTDADGSEWQYLDIVEIFDPERGWSSGTPAPYPIAGAASCTLDERIFVFGGELNNETSIYNVRTDSWSTATPPPTARNGHQCVRVGETFFLIGGRDERGALSLVETYDPRADTWQTQGELNTSRHWFGAAALADRIYVFGGEHTGLLDDVEAIDVSARDCASPFKP